MEAGGAMRPAFGCGCINLSNTKQTFIRLSECVIIHNTEVISMCVVSINVPEEILLDLHESENDFATYMKCMLAVDLYKNKKVSLGYCASIADMSKEDFIKYLGKNEISIFSFENEKEFMEELANA